MKNTDIEIITSIKTLLSASKMKLVIVPHENPDGDAIGSALGLGQVLADFGHEVKVLSSNDYPVFLKWFSADVPVIIYDKDKKKAKSWLKQADAMICVDFNEASRAGKLEKKILEFDKKKVLIDHHPYPTQFCDFMVSETSYSSTCELVFDVLTETGFSPYFSQKAAEALYTGILTDTGGFSHNISKNTFKVVSELLNHDIETDKIQSAVFHNFSADRMKLLGFCLNEKMQVFPEYRAAVISITKEELERFNFQPGDTEGFVNYPLSIKNIVFSALFIEKDEYVKASFRSKGNFPANEFSSSHFNGGGHLNAAGGESELDFEKTLLKFTQLLPEYKHQLLETTI
ncbi:bifunctional oligoribonuclease/PAP phosphatase NrnA [Draconibacterium sp. IB214405]|uniref:DHH family phosphoesterase n=1 Tax=Draconibacterium sp. IB214405 TaxID=3097352 RepID=UPI002A135588|nr:bifunctional oligoribonuclease/PAP phosphatase NrnA [Draconibacterium sp. IB214405]MDX8339812.1 bifunctional oligoribonuclease/PAP phosphatase NrnA [Draconibacterium sp. IB214405]